MGNVISIKDITAGKKAAHHASVAAQHKESPYGQPLVYIVLLNYKRPDLTEACIQSLQALTYPNVRLVVVDNHSRDDSCKRLSCHPSIYRFLASPFNSGYSAGNNLGIRLALAEGADYVWILNNDTLVDPEALTQLVQVAEAQGHGLYGSVLKDTEKGNFLYAGGVIYPWRGKTRGLTQQEYDNGLRPEYLSGASMLISRRVLEQVGLLEESYFLYAEDIEYCVRAQRAGFPIVSVPQSTVLHYQGAASGGRERPINQYYGHRNRLKLFWRWASPLQKVVIAFQRAVELFLYGFKAVFHPSPARKQRYQKRFQIYGAACRDFIAGVRGAAPHPF